LDFPYCITNNRKILYETLGAGWEKNLWYKEIEHWLTEWDGLEDTSRPTSDIVSGLKFQGDRMVEDIEWEIQFEISGGDEMAKARVFGYDI
jgi:hypothetical protein